MLILSRKPGETVIVRVGETEIRVTVAQIVHPGAVKIGFDAPREVTILREELIDRDKRRDQQ